MDDLDVLSLHLLISTERPEIANNYTTVCRPITDHVITNLCLLYYPTASRNQRALEHLAQEQL